MSSEKNINSDSASGKRWLWALLAIYLFLLALSWFIQWQFPAAGKDVEYESTRLIHVPGDDRYATIRYFRIQKGEPGPNSFVLLPDVLRDPADLFPFAESLSEKSGADVIIPLYPEKFNDGGEISFSLESRAKMIRTFLDSLNISNVHMGGYRYGGLVLAEFAKLANESELTSATFLTSMGIEEMHFLGNYRINRSLYALMIPVITVWEYAIPHFGSFYRQPVNKAFVSAMLGMDQRGIEEKLRGMKSPVLILHPENDSFLPLHTAEEIHRLIPQSSFYIPDQSAESMLTKPEIWTEFIADFIHDVAEGRAITANNADPERIEKAEEALDYDDIDALAGMALLTIVLLLMLSTLISEDLACIAAGLLVATGILQFQYAVLGCFLGILTADVFIYWLGRWIGSPVLSWVPFRWFIKKRDIEWAEDMFEMRGAEIIFATRFLPGTRFPTYLAAGMVKTSFPAFLAYFIAAIAIWTPFLVGVSALIGQPMISFLEIYQEYALVVVILFFALIYTILKHIIPLGTVKGRRELYVKWIRIKEKFWDSD